MCFLLLMLLLLCCFPGLLKCKPADLTVSDTDSVLLYTALLPVVALLHAIHYFPFSVIKLLIPI